MASTSRSSRRTRFPPHRTGCADARGLFARARGRARHRSLSTATGRQRHGPSRAGGVLGDDVARRATPTNVETDVVRTPEGGPSPCPATFATSANACLRRDVWEQVRFREIPYAEDQQLALDLLAAGFAKVFQPAAPVVHSHEYGPVAKFRRTFDEFRGLHDVYGHVEGLGLGPTLGRARVEARRDRAWLQREGVPRGELAAATLSSFTSHLARNLGAGLGTRAHACPRSCAAGARSTDGPSLTLPATTLGPTVGPSANERPRLCIALGCRRSACGGGARLGALGRSRCSCARSGCRPYT